MKQFYETYKDNEIVSHLVTQLGWTNNLIILSMTSSMEEKEFYIRLCLKNNYKKEELIRQIKSGYYERYMLSDNKYKQVVEYTMNKNLSKTKISEYTLKLIDKKLLENKLKEIKKYL